MDVQCCVCKKVRLEERWVVLDALVPHDVETSHGYCPGCAGDAFQEVRDYHRHNLRAESKGPDR